MFGERGRLIPAAVKLPDRIESGSISRSGERPHQAAALRLTDAATFEAAPDWSLTPSSLLAQRMGREPDTDNIKSKRLLLTLAPGTILLAPQNIALAPGERPVYQLKGGSSALANSLVEAEVALLWRSNHLMTFHFGPEFLGRNETGDIELRFRGLFHAGLPRELRLTRWPGHALPF
jgi:hypothetical protein